MLENELYLEDIKEVAEYQFDWNKLNNKTIMISGSTGLIGKFLIDVIMYKNKVDNLNCKVIALGRNIEKAKGRLDYFENDLFEFVEGDINERINIDEPTHFIIHAASSTHPLQYSKEPISTVMANVMGTYNLLNYAKDHDNERFIFISSVEIYGENKGDVEKFSEDYLGYINCNTLRAGYPESKRTGETLCQAFIKEYNMDVVIPRLSRCFGPTLLNSDTKALSQFIKNGINKEDIVLKSAGDQYYSYLYGADAVKGILLCLFKGENGKAYNISDEGFDITLKDLATIIADYAGTKVIFDLPSEDERKGFSTATKAILDNTELKKLGFEVSKDIKSRLGETIDILGEIN